jgi:hypothetical protein
MSFTKVLQGFCKAFAGLLHGFWKGFKRVLEDFCKGLEGFWEVSKEFAILSRRKTR